MNVEQSAKFLAELASANRSDAIEKAKHERHSFCISRRGMNRTDAADELAEAFSKIAPNNNLAQLMKEAILNPQDS